MDIADRVFLQVDGTRRASLGQSLCGVRRTAADVESFHRARHAVRGAQNRFRGWIGGKRFTGVGNRLGFPSIDEDLHLGEVHLIPRSDDGSRFLKNLQRKSSEKGTERQRGSGYLIDGGQAESNNLLGNTESEDSVEIEFLFTDSILSQNIDEKCLQLQFIDQIKSDMMSGSLQVIEVVQESIRPCPHQRSNSIKSDCRNRNIDNSSLQDIKCLLSLVHPGAAFISAAGAIELIQTSSGD